MGSYWRIDVPPIRIDPAVLHNDEIISVRVDIYDPTAATPICPVCVACLCTCEIQVAKVCCAGPAPSTALTFNYFTSLTRATTGTGSPSPIRLQWPVRCDPDGTRTGWQCGTTTVSVPAGCGLFVDMLENLTWTGTGLGGVPRYITANCNFGCVVFGFGMMANGSGASMGYKVP